MTRLGGDVLVVPSRANVPQVADEAAVAAATAKLNWRRRRHSGNIRDLRCGVANGL